MYNQRKLNRLVFLYIYFFLDVDKRCLTKFDGHPMIGELTTPCGVILLVDSSVAVNDDELNPLMIRMRALWSAGIAVIKPWNGFLTKTSLERRPTFSGIQYHNW